MPKELKLAFDMCLLTDGDGNALDEDGKIYDPTKEPEKAVFVPVLVDAWQNPNIPDPRSPSVPKAFRSPQGWRNPVVNSEGEKEFYKGENERDKGEKEIYKSTFNTEQECWKRGEFPNDILDK